MKMKNDCDSRNPGFHRLHLIGATDGNGLHAEVDACYLRNRLVPEKEIPLFFAIPHSRNGEKPEYNANIEVAAMAESLPLTPATASELSARFLNHMGLRF